MTAPTTHGATTHAGGNEHSHDQDHGHEHAHGHELPFWRKYIFSVDHKMIGLQYGLTALVFLLVGFSLMMLMRWQLAYPGRPLGWVGKLLGENAMPGGVMAPEFYNQLGAINFIVTIVQLRAKGLGFWRLPFFVHAQFVTSFLLLLAFPPLEAAAVLQLMDRLAGTSFFLPTGLVVSGEQLKVAGGGSPLLWQHLFWFLAHPEVYVLILPGMGIVAEVIANNTRKPLWGYRLLVYSVIFLGFMSFVV